MPQIRYMGMVLGELDDASPRDARLGRFVAMTEPMPVGTVVELDSARLRITRAEEGQHPGCWLSPDATPSVVVDERPTIPTMSVIPMLSDDQSKEISILPATEDAVPEPIEPADPKKRQRRRGKTVVGR